MRKGGLLDGFPVHLFAGSGEASATLILDSRDLGRVQVAPPPEVQGTAIAVSVDKNCLAQSRESYSSLDRGTVHLVQADSRWLPLRDGSIEVVVAPSSNIRAGAPTSGAELSRVLGRNGQLVEIVRTSKLAAAERLDLSSEPRTYYARPASGGSYFVTRDWIPSPWPFRSVHHGRLRTLRTYADLMVSRLRVRPLYDSVCLRIHSRTQASGFVSHWAEASGQREDGAEPSPCSKSPDLYVKARWNALLLGCRETGVIVKAPLGAKALQVFQNHAESLDSVVAMGDSALRSALPKAKGQGTIQGQSYWVESWLDGMDGTTFKWSPNWRRKTARSAAQYIVDLHGSTARQTEISRSVFDELLQPSVAIVETEARKADPGFDLSPLVEALWALFAGQQMPLVRTHGDFWPGNVLVSDEGRLTGVLDWDSSVEVGWPLVDLLHFIAFQHKWRARWFFGRVVTRKLMPLRLSGLERELVGTYLSSLNIKEELRPGLVAIYWLTRASRCSRSFGEGWTRRNVVRPLPRILEAVLEAVLARSLAKGRGTPVSAA